MPFGQYLGICNTNYMRRSAEIRKVFFSPHHIVFQHENKATRVYPKVSGLASWSDNCK
jgi:hypothetical protein